MNTLKPLNTLEFYQAYATAKGSQCTSELRATERKIGLVCSARHHFKLFPFMLDNDIWWCPKCSPDEKSIVTQKIVALLGGAYDKDNKLICARKHKPCVISESEIIHGRWCTECELYELNNIVRPRGYIAIALRDDVVDISCSLGHVTHARLENLHTLSPDCRICRKQIERVKSLHELKGWKVKAIVRENDAVIATLECHNFHSPIVINTDIGPEHSCQLCTGKTMWNNDKEIEKLASENAYAVVKIIHSGLSACLQCGKGHEPIMRSLSSLRDGHWCKICEPSAKVVLCRSALKRLAGCDFPATELSGLKLDGYNKDRAIAFVYKSKHAYLHEVTPENVKAQLDKRKEIYASIRRVCHARKIELIEVPHLDQNVEMYMTNEYRSLSST